MEILQTKTINAGNARYLSEIKELENGLPYGIFNKVLTDTGGTFLANNCNNNYITVVPFKRLADSIADDKNNQLNVLKVYEGVSYKDFSDYLQNNKIHKIVVTYDSFPKVLNWLERLGFELSNYKVLVDEYHLLFEELGYRAEAILNLLDTLKRVTHFTFMSATPLKSFTPKALENLPYTEVQWDESRLIKIKVMGKPLRNVYKGVASIIDEFKQGRLTLEHNGKDVQVKQLFIYINSVKAIEQIAMTTKLKADEVDIICADNQRNSFVLTRLPISKTPRLGIPITFLTKTGFQGCNFFSNNALTIVVSDNTKEHTLVDVSTTLHQIAGRIRINKDFNNVFKDKLWHLYSINKRVFDSDEEIKEIAEEIEKHTQTIIKGFNAADEDYRELMIMQSRVDVDGLFCYYNKETNLLDYSEDLKNYLVYRFELVNKVYKDGFNIRISTQNGNFDVEKLNRKIELERIELEKAAKTNFRALLEYYIKIKEENQDLIKIAKWEKEFPLFKDAYDLLGVSGIKSSGYVEKDLREKVFAKSPKTLDMIFLKFYQKYGEGAFVSLTDAKDFVKETYEKLGIKGIRPTAQILNECVWFYLENKTINLGGKRVKGFTIKSYWNTRTATPIKTV